MTSKGSLCIILQNTRAFQSSLWNFDKDSYISRPSAADFSWLFIYIFILFFLMQSSVSILTHFETEV